MSVINLVVDLKDRNESNTDSFGIPECMSFKCIEICDHETVIVSLHDTLFLTEKTTFQREGLVVLVHANSSVRMSCVFFRSYDMAFAKTSP